mgnify:CR=1 FL=1
MDVNKPNSEKQVMNQSTKPDDQMGLNVSGHILIRDKQTGQEIVNKRNAIHYGNMAYIVAQALSNNETAYIHYLAFGNGGTSVDTAGKVSYKTPRVTEGYESGANLYSRTYWKAISDSDENSDQVNNNISIIPGQSYTDIKCTCTLAYNEPSGQDTFDSSTTNEGDYIFDELALFSYPTDTGLATPEEIINTSTMLTHVLFHPVQKSSNREIEVIYTIRVQLS